MKTDTFFYELFRIDPRSLFELVGLDMEGEYIFESITVKGTEKRFDGYMKRTDGTGPNVFVEFQGYPDKKIYWRIFREISTWYEQKDDETPFVVIVIFVDKKFKPEKCHLSCVRPNRMIRMTLAQCLKKLGGKGGVLTVLKPFGLSDKEKLPESVSQWTEEIESLELPEYQIKKLTELLEYFILQCFQKLTLKEVRKMMLTPLEETTAVKELMQIKSEEWKKEGRKEGKKETALNLLKKGMDTKFISQVTGLTVKEIKQLK